MLRTEITLKLTFLAIASLALCQCATQEVKQELNQNVVRKGTSYARELAAQSPFKKVEMSWKEASELMKERNPKYRQALIEKQESKIKKGLVNNFTYEVRKSLTSSVQTTLNPSEIAQAMQNPIGSLPRQLKSITDLKNISHSLNQSEWDRVTQSVQADVSERRELVNLHVLFCESENLISTERNLEKLAGKIATDEALKANKALSMELVKAQAALKKERTEWLNQVRNFFNAEYFDVEFNDYTRKLTFYREVSNPEFSDWKRWRMLENSGRLAAEMQKQHIKDKPVLPGLKLITHNLGMDELQSSLGQQTALNENMAKEVRQMLKNWRTLKSLQQQIAVSEPKLEGLQSPVIADLKLTTAVFQLKKKEIEQLKGFWMIDENCWSS